MKEVDRLVRLAGVASFAVLTHRISEISHFHLLVFIRNAIKETNRNF